MIHGTDSISLQRGILLGRFRNILDMIAKKADHSVLRLLQISQQHIESQLERVKHERELWKEVRALGRTGGFRI